MSASLALTINVNAPVSGVPWQPVSIGGGGQVNYVDVADDGTAICGADVFGAYVRTPGATRWEQLLTSSRLPGEAWALPLSGTGSYAGAICKKNSSIIYIVQGQYSGSNARVYVSQDRGASFQRCGSSFQQGMNANAGSNRFWGHHMGVDPNFPNLAIVVTESNGTWITANGLSGPNAVWTKNSFMAACDGNRFSAVAIDGNSGVNGSGYSNRAYVAVSGSGLYYTTDGGASWTLSTACGAQIGRLSLGTDGTLYVLAQSQSALWRVTISGGVLNATPIMPPNINQVTCLVCDPSNAQHITAFEWNPPNFQDSVNQGASWSTVNNTRPTLDATDSPWHTQLFAAGGLGLLDMAADPSSNKIYGCGYQAMLMTTYPMQPAGTAQHWTDVSLGVEECVCLSLCFPPGGNGTLLMGAEDVGVVTVTNPPNTPPSSYFNTPGGNIDPCHWVDYASSDGATCVAIFGGFPGVFGGSAGGAISSDHGQTWRMFASAPPGSGGAGGIAAASPTNIMYQPAAGGTAPSYTLNGGSSWSSISGPPSSGWAGSVGYGSTVLAADRVNIGTFYLWGNGGLWVSTDGGITWALHSGSATVGVPTLRAVPSHAGHLFLGSWGGSGGSFSNPGYPFYRLIFNGSSVTVQNTGLTCVFGHDLGAPALGASYPAIYAYGFNGATLGVWRSIDTTPTTIGTWQLLGNAYPDGGVYPNGWIDSVFTLAASKDVYGVVAYGCQGSSCAYGQFP